METTKVPKIVAIDGPAGSGKSTIASLVSRRLGWDYLNTGGIYRLIGFLAKKNGVALTAEEELAELITRCTPNIEWHEGNFYFQGSDVSKDLQKEEIGKLASDIAKSKIVRKLLLPVQRQLALSAPKGVIIDGRDIGTVVFPNADLKIFMVANLEARAQRRHKQMLQQDPHLTLTLSDLMREIQARDDQDEQRSVAPLQRANDALDFDTSELNLEACVEKISELIQTRLIAMSS